MKELISIVVPIYNVEEYLPRCLDSIIAQSYDYIEILLVDDGSPDNAGVICDEYAQSDNRIKVFHTPNEGVAKARQRGVENSKGEYIVFVDPDDWLPLDSIKTLYSSMSQDVDLVIGGYAIDGKKTKVMQAKSGLLTHSDYINALLLSQISPAPWAKLYRRKLFTSDSFPKFKKGQDLLMNVDVSTNISQNVRVISDSVYFYFQRANSTISTHKSDFEYEKKFAKVVKNILESSNILAFHASELVHFEILRLYIVIMSGSICPQNDPWVQAVIKDSANTRLSTREKLIICSLKNRFLQKILKSTREFILKVTLRY